MQEIDSRLRRLERRDWWLWWSAVVVMLLLTAAVASYSSSPAWREDDVILQFRLTQAVRGLIGLILIFVIYMSYQRVLIKRLRHQMAEQFKVMTKLELRADEFEKLAILDALTGLYNRRFAEQRLTEEMARAHRSTEPLAVLIVDLDDFKLVNDQFGHASGDLVLKHFADRLERAIRVSDVAVRWGGDEFLLILPNFRHGQVEDLLHRLLPVEVELPGRKVTVSLSAGWAHYQAGEQMEQLLERADQALLGRKRTGKNSGGVPATIPAPAEGFSPSGAK